MTAKTDAGQEVVVEQGEGINDPCFGYAEDREVWLGGYVNGQYKLPVFEGDKVVIEPDEHGVFHIKSVLLPEGDPRNIPEGS